MTSVSQSDVQMYEEVYTKKPDAIERTTHSLSRDSKSQDNEEEISPMHIDQSTIEQKNAAMTPKGNTATMPAAMSYRFSMNRMLPPQNLRSVVTTSFSIDEERDDMMRGYVRAPSNLSFEQRTDISERRVGHGEREGWKTSPQAVYFAPATPSPKHNRMNDRGFLHRAYSSPGYFSPSEAMKRSYYHHTQSMNQYHGHQLPPEFMPPMKRSRIEPMRKEILVSPRESMETHAEKPPVQRTQSFPTRPLPIHGHVPLSPSGVHFSGCYHTMTTNKYAQVSPASDLEESPRSWTTDVSWAPSPYARPHGPHFWDSPRNEAYHANMSSPKSNLSLNPSSQKSQNAMDHHKPVSRPSGGNDKMRMMVEAANSALRESTSNPNPTPSYQLLAMPDDRMSLSETLCVVRENIEVFTATKADVDAPAPGRKHAVVVGQVGLRCIHCRHTVRNSDRVKRAVCYPSSIKRIYRTVIDMKLDHFSQCKFVPMSLKNRLDKLKAVHTRSTGTTMLYFIKAAKSMGMENGPSGVVFADEKGVMSIPKTLNPTSKESREAEPSTVREGISTGVVGVNRCDSLSSGSWMSGERDGAQPRVDSMSSWSFESRSGSAGAGPFGLPESAKNTTSTELNFEGMVPLSLPEDKTALSPLRCFLREQVCAFSATEKDIAVRAPTTFSISVGQVGIGCIHCVKQSARHRSNRAVCFPFSIGRIYQSVADIQRFHFGECRMMPDEIKYKFLDLQSASSKGSKGLATRQYWMSSARKIGLVDTPTGIRFGRDPLKPETANAFSLDILAQVAFSVTTASKPLVVPEDKPCIAEFLYVVMEQLQPCRFTEADRNKRRLKDVGCIGVECKHCAGQVDSRKFFWSSVSAVESNFVSVHTHVMECKCVPASLKERLINLKKLRKEQTAALRTGSQKSFFARVWQRLHDTDSMMEDDQTLPSTQFRELQKSASNSSSSTAGMSLQYLAAPVDATTADPGLEITPDKDSESKTDDEELATEITSV